MCYDYDKVTSLRLPIPVSVRAHQPHNPFPAEKPQDTQGFFAAVWSDVLGCAYRSRVGRPEWTVLTCVGNGRSLEVPQRGLAFGGGCQSGAVDREQLLALLEELEHEVAARLD